MDFKKIESRIPDILKEVEIQKQAEDQPASSAGLGATQDQIESVKNAAAESPLFGAITDSSETEESRVVAPSVGSDLMKLSTEQLAERIADLFEGIDLSKLENLKEVVRAIAPEIQESQLERLIGIGSGLKGGSGKGIIDGLKEASQSGVDGRDRAKELIGGMDLRLVGGSLVSEDPASSGEGNDGGVEPPSLKDILINFIIGLGTSKSPIPAPPVPPNPETGKDMWDGVSLFQNVLGDRNYDNYINKRGGVDTNGTPNPDAERTGGPVFITREMLIGIAARLGSRGEPNPESQAGSGGPINETKASGGATGPAGEPAVEIDRAVLTLRDIDAIKIRIESKFRQS